MLLLTLGACARVTVLSCVSSTTLPVAIRIFNNVYYPVFILHHNYNAHTAANHYLLYLKGFVSSASVEQQHKCSYSGLQVA